jgi:hypothetical protein
MEKTVCFSYKDQKGEAFADKCNVKNIQSTEMHCVFKDVLQNMAINVETIDL